MGAQLIWLGSLALEIAILFRGALAGLFKKYPFFYAYIGCVLLKGSLRLVFYRFAPVFYVQSSWFAELATIVASYAVVIEIFRWMFRNSPGVANAAQKALLFVFMLTASFTATDLLSRKGISLLRMTAELSRDLRYVEGALLLVMLWLFGRCRISIGRNLFGLIVGFSFWVGLNVINLALLFAPGNRYSVGLARVLPITYVITLVIWCAALWSLQPEPAQPAENTIERDYQAFVAKTRTTLGRLPSRIARTLQP
jgi:hypothetical protein